MQGGVCCLPEHKFGAFQRAVHHGLKDIDDSQRTLQPRLTTRTSSLRDLASSVSRLMMLQVHPTVTSPSCLRNSCNPRTSNCWRPDVQNQPTTNTNRPASTMFTITLSHQKEHFRHCAISSGFTGSNFVLDGLFVAVATVARREKSSRFHKPFQKGVRPLDAWLVAQNVHSPTNPVQSSPKKIQNESQRAETSNSDPLNNFKNVQILNFLTKSVCTDLFFEFEGLHCMRTCSF